MFNHQHMQQHMMRQLQQLYQHQQPPAPPPPPPQAPASHPNHHHHHHHHQGGRPTSAPMQAPPHRMVRFCSTSQATVMAGNPMFQGALLMQQMQGNMRGFAVGGQQFTQFFSAGSRHSLLGPAPMGVAMKSPHMGFPRRHFHPRAQYYNKDFASQQTGRNRENEPRAVWNTNGSGSGGVAQQPKDGQSGSKNTEGENNIRAASTEGAVAAAADTDTDRHTIPSAQLQEEPALKKQRIAGSEGLTEEPPETDGALNSVYKVPAEDKEPADVVTLEEAESMAEPETIEFIEECRAPEVVGVGATLKVTIQQSSESRAFNTGLEEQAVGGAGAAQGEARDSDGDAANKFFCYICSTTCQNQQDFQSHMNSLVHQQRMMEIQHMSNACLVTLLPRVRESLENAHRDGEKRLGPHRWCATCQTHFSGDLILHRRTREHKLAKHTSRPFCTVCKRHFRTPRKFVEHMKSPEHKQRVEELREDGLPEVLEELITVDAVGCFEGEEDYEEEPNEQEEEMEEEQQSSHSQGGPVAHMEVKLEDMVDNQVYDPDTQYGSSFVVPVAGFLCRLCHKFYHFESTARLSHCQSLTHFQNLQKYRALRRQEDTGEPDASSDSVVETHGVREEGEENRAMPDPSSLSPGPASLHARTLTKSGSAALPNLSITALSATGPQPPGDPSHKRPEPGSADHQPVPRDHALEEVDCTLKDGVACPQQRDSSGEGSQRQAVPGKQDPPSQDGEEPATQDQTEEEEDHEEEEKEVNKERKAATGCKQAASKKRSATMRQRVKEEKR